MTVTHESQSDVEEGGEGVAEGRETNSNVTRRPLASLLSRHVEPFRALVRCDEPSSKQGTSLLYCKVLFTIYLFHAKQTFLFLVSRVDQPVNAQF